MQSASRELTRWFEQAATAVRDIQSCGSDLRCNHRAAHSPSRTAPSALPLKYDTLPEWWRELLLHAESAVHTRTRQWTRRSGSEAKPRSGGRHPRTEQKDPGEDDIKDCKYPPNCEMRDDVDCGYGDHLPCCCDWKYGAPTSWGLRPSDEGAPGGTTGGPGSGPTGGDTDPEDDPCAIWERACASERAANYALERMDCECSKTDYGTLDARSCSEAVREFHQRRKDQAKKDQRAAGYLPCGVNCNYYGYPCDTPTDPATKPAYATPPGQCFEWGKDAITSSGAPIVTDLATTTFFEGGSRAWRWTGSNIDDNPVYYLHCNGKYHYAYKTDPTGRKVHYFQCSYDADGNEHYTFESPPDTCREKGR